MRRRAGGGRGWARGCPLHLGISCVGGKILVGLWHLDFGCNNAGSRLVEDGRGTGRGRRGRERRQRREGRRGERRQGGRSGWQASSRQRQGSVSGRAAGVRVGAGHHPSASLQPPPSPCGSPSDVAGERVGGVWRRAGCSKDPHHLPFGGRTRREPWERHDVPSNCRDMCLRLRALSSYHITRRGNGRKKGRERQKKT